MWALTKWVRHAIIFFLLVCFLLIPFFNMFFQKMIFKFMFQLILVICDFFLFAYLTFLDRDFFKKKTNLCVFNS